MTFGDSGKRIDEALVFWDHETSSLWEQWTATAFTGTLRGIRLSRLPMPTTRWEDWLAEHPDTVVLEEP